MALQGSGPISFSQMRDEFGLSNPVSMSSFYGRPNVPGNGVIRSSDFYNAANIQAVSIAMGTNFVLTSQGAFTALNPSFPINVTLTGAASASSTGVYAFNTGNLTAYADVTLNINGTVRGKGGGGGGSAGGGGGGGPAMLLTGHNITVFNNSTIYGGGGGGGGGGNNGYNSLCFSGSKTTSCSVSGFTTLFGGSGGTGYGPGGQTGGGAGQGASGRACSGTSCITTVVVYAGNGGSGGGAGGTGGTGGLGGAAGGAGGLAYNRQGYSISFPSGFGSYAGGIA